MDGATTLGDLVREVAAPVHRDERGRLVAVDFADLGLDVQRVFVVDDVPAGTERGGHSHERGTQVLFCLAGRIEVEVRTETASAWVELVPNGTGLEISAGVWSRQRYPEPGGRLLVLASHPFDPTSYRNEPVGPP